MKISKLSESQKARIVDLHGQGKSERFIAASVGCSRSGVWGYLRKVHA